MIERPPLLPRAAVLLAVLALVGVVGGPLLASVGVVAPMTGFTIFLAGALDGLAALVIGLLALFTSRGRPGRGGAWFGVAVGLAVSGVVLVSASPGRGLPRINDITTSPDDPPAFEAAGQDEPNRGRDMSYPADFAAQQRSAYSDLRSVSLGLPPAEAFERCRKAAEQLGWEIVAADPARGHLEARATSGLFRFVDDIVVRVAPAPDGSTVDVRSKSRDGQGDLGINAARIRAFASKLR